MEQYHLGSVSTESGCYIVSCGPQSYVCVDTNPAWSAAAWRHAGYRVDAIVNFPTPARLVPSNNPSLAGYLRLQMILSNLQAYCLTPNSMYLATVPVGNQFQMQPLPPLTWQALQPPVS